MNIFNDLQSRGALRCAIDMLDDVDELIRIELPNADGEESAMIRDLIRSRLDAALQKLSEVRDRRAAASLRRYHKRLVQRFTTERDRR